MYAEINLRGIIWKKVFDTELQPQLDTHRRWKLDIGGELFTPTELTVLSSSSHLLTEMRVLFSNDTIESKTFSCEQRKSLEQLLQENNWIVSF